MASSVQALDRIRMQGKLQATMEAIDEIVTKIQDVYSSGAVEGYTPETLDTRVWEL